jgi:hypothetical protein
VRAELGLPISIGVARTKHLAKIASQVAKPDGLVVVDPETELDFLHDLPVELMWGVGPVTQARLAEIGVHTIGQLAKRPGYSLERLLGRASGEKLTALAWNRDPREIRTHHRAQSAGAQSALGKKPAEEQVFRPALRHLADRVASRLRAKSRPGRTVTVRVRFADLHSVTRSITLDAPISATATLAEIAEELVRTALADHPEEKTISLLAISVSHLEKHWKVQLELPLGLEDEKRRPGTERGMARWTVDRAVDVIRNRFGWDAVGYGSVVLGPSRSVPDEFRELAERTCRPLAMTLPVLRLPGGNQSSASRCPCVRRIGMRTPVLLCCTFPARGCTWYIGGRMISYGCSRPTDEVGQVVLHGSLGSNPKTPAAQTPVVRVLPRARCRQGSGNLRSRRATSRRRQQVLARPFPVALQAVSRQYEAVYRDARFPSRYIGLDGWPLDPRHPVYSCGR